MKVKECMCRDVSYAKPETPLYFITKIMKDEHIGCIPICNENLFVEGLLTDRDIITRAVACDKDVKNTPASEIMTTKIYCCNAEDDIETVQSKMGKYQVRRIPVVEDSGKIVGIVTMGDLANYADNIGKKEVCNTIEDICNCDGQVRNCF